MKSFGRTVTAIILASGFLVGVVDAAILFSSGTKTWDTVSTNWGTSSGGPYTVTNWNNATPDTAFLEGAAGTVTLGEPISIQNVTIDAPSAGYYTIRSNTLGFAAGGGITVNSSQGGNFITVATIASAITGTPSVVLNTGGNIETAFSPTSGSMQLGAKTGAGMISLGGTTTGNTLASAANKTRWNGSGSWTLTGLASAYEHFINSGDLIVSSGTLRSNNRALHLQGGTLHYNNPAAVYDGSSGNPASNNGGTLAFTGGNLDNTSGGAITNSTYNPDQYWGADWTFIGSLGTNSDLDIGSGGVLLPGDRQVTVQNAATTFTVGGNIQDAGNAYSLTKAGAGTLELTGTSTYTGETVIDGGTLSITKPYLGDITAVRIAGGAVLDLNFVGTDAVFAVYTNGVLGPQGTWGAPGSGADNETAQITGTGFLNVPVPEPLEGIRYWDGGSTNLPDDGNAVSAGGSGTWNTTTNNWDAGAGVAHTNWNNATNDLAFFRGTAGTVTLAEEINLGSLRFETDGYTIISNTLNFAPGGSITNASTTGGNGGRLLTIASGITGAPTVRSMSGDNRETAFAPTDSTVTLGACIGPGGFEFAGTTVSNSVESIASKSTWSGSGEWTVAGNVVAYEHFINSGTLIVNGLLRCNNRALHFSGGTLVANGTVEVAGGNTINMSAGTTLKGTGVVSDGDLPTVPAGATLAPGDPTGTLTITNGNCAIAGTLAITIDGTDCSTLAVDPAHTLTISNATLDVSVIMAPGAGTFVIATYGAGNLVGDDFAAVTGLHGLRGSPKIDYAYNSGTAIAITVSSGTVLQVR